MAIAPSTAVGAFLDAVLARDFEQIRGLLHPDVDFRAMTPNRIWEADGAAGVEEVLRTWFADPDEEVLQIDATDGAVVEDTARVGWRVRARDADGEFVFEQQAYVRENEGRIAWLRVSCSGTRPTG